MAGPPTLEALAAGANRACILPRRRTAARKGSVYNGGHPKETDRRLPVRQGLGEWRTAVRTGLRILCLQACFEQVGIVVFVTSGWTFNAARGSIDPGINSAEGLRLRLIDHRVRHVELGIELAGQHTIQLGSSPIAPALPKSAMARHDGYGCPRATRRLWRMALCRKARLE